MVALGWFWCMTFAVIMGVSSAALAVAPGENLSGLELKHIESGVLGSKDLQGKVTLINFWATWCEACKIEIREMEDQLKVLAQDPKVQVAFVSLDKDSTQAKEWFKSHLKEPEFWLKKLYVDPQFTTADDLKIDAFPMTLVVGPQRDVIHVQRGFKAGEGSTERMVALVHQAKDHLR